MVQMMKQSTVFYLGDFTPLDIKVNPETNDDFVMSDMDIVQAKNGSIKAYTSKLSKDDEKDDDPNYAYQKQLLDNKAKLRQFCSQRSSAFGAGSYENYDLLGNIDDNKDKITQLKNVVNSLLKYEPQKDNIIQKYPILFQ
jgi:hypothetical protein